MKRTAVQTAVAIHDHRANIALAVIAGCLILAAFYAINLYELVSRTIAVRQADSAAAALSNEASSLDAQYLSLAGRITPDAMASHGLIPGKVAVYINVPAKAATLSLASGHEL